MTAFLPPITLSAIENQPPPRPLFGPELGGVPLGVVSDEACRGFVFRSGESSADSEVWVCNVL